MRRARKRHVIVEASERSSKRNASRETHREGPPTPIFGRARRACKAVQRDARARKSLGEKRLHTRKRADGGHRCTRRHVRQQKRKEQQCFVRLVTTSSTSPREAATGASTRRRRKALGWRCPDVVEVWDVPQIGSLLKCVPPGGGQGGGGGDTLHRAGLWGATPPIGPILNNFGIRLKLGRLRASLAHID